MLTAADYNPTQSFGDVLDMADCLPAAFVFRDMVHNLARIFGSVYPILLVNSSILFHEGSPFVGDHTICPNGGGSYSIISGPSR